ncbi:iron uptake porin [Calothrix sp. UHCC 0171]|uniref:iron uptake porin n=1 Tax=Calothrix sp. UHCC 0171 TaxID=3110245 RepID=UPI002B1FE7A1|nr:iron uptake porin [Calothrix sp. UHCC 0171]MEA5573909.1 iron uptake porin [Calothrix sp. UHCC 0171]
MLIAGIYGLPEKALSSKLPELDESNILTKVPEMGVRQKEVSNNNNDNSLGVKDLSFTSTSPLFLASTPVNDEINGDENIINNPIDNPGNGGESMSQVTSVSQLKDVQPTDWAFQALQSLVERYGCIAGYPDGTFKGNRALTRYEFAAGLNACLNRVNELIGTATESNANREDLAQLQKLQEEFSAELATLRGRVDNLEARSAEIAANQFSTTTQMFGVAIIGIQGRTNNRADIAPRDGIKDSPDRGTNTSIVNLNQIYLNTQFDPQSYLVTGLLASKGGTAPRLGNDLILGYEFPTDNDLILSDLRYHRLLSKNFAIMVGSTNVNMTNAFRGPNRIESAATGPLSFFAQRNPILDIGFTGQAGIAFDWQFAKRASLQAVYASLNAGNPNKRNGLFDGNTTAAVQLLVTPTDAIDVSLYYLNNYSSNGCLLTFVGDDCLTASNPLTNKTEPLQTNAFGATLNWQLSPKFTIGAWGGYTNSNIPGKSGKVETTNWMVYFNFPDLFRKGNLGGLYIGQPPKITNSTLPLGNNVPDIINGGLGQSGGQPGTTTQIEAFYRFQVTNNISITPGIIHIIEPGHTPDSDSVTMGVLRSTFAF